MNNAHRLHHSMPRFHLGDIGLVLLNGGLLVLAVGTLLPSQLQFLIQWLNLCGLVLIYSVVAILVGLFKARVDDYTERGDSLF